MVYIHQKGFLNYYNCFLGSISSCNFGRNMEILLKNYYLSIHWLVILRSKNEDKEIFW